MGSFDEWGSALDTVVAALNNLEDNPNFDAGVGSVLMEDDTVEMDAMIMHGATLWSRGRGRFTQH